MRKRLIAALICIVMLLGMLPAVSAADEPVPGPVVVADPASPTGYTGRFTYYDPTASQVYFCGDLNLSNFEDRSDTRTYAPKEYRPGLTRRGGSQFKEPMQKLDGGYWYYELPLAAGANQYWFNIGNNNRMMPDPANAPKWSPNSSATKDAYNCVYVPYDEKQGSELLKAREAELPRETEKGSWEYVPYKVGNNTFYMGVYLPYGYDENRAEPYKTVYLVHGWGQDESDWMGIGSAPNIMDNLIAEDRTASAVVVSLPNNNNSIGSQNDKYAALFNTVLQHYNVSGDAKDRALAGLSMGSRYTRAVMETDPESFGYYGLFSCSETITPSTPNLDKAHILIGVGVFDGANYQNATTTNTQNMEKGGFFSKTLNVAGAHDFNTWSQLLRMFAEDYLWKPWAFGDGTAPAVDKTALAEAIALYEFKPPMNYTVESIRVHDAAVAHAKEIYAREDATQAEVDAAAQDLIDAARGLTAPDWSALEPAVEAARKVDRSKYTEESVAALDAALKTAEVLIGEGSVLQSDIDAAAEALTAAVSSLVPKDEPPFLFDDVRDEGKFYFGPVYWAYFADPQITNGVDATHFGPDNPCTRGHVVTFLWRAAGCPEPAAAESPFTDLKPGAFYEKAVAWAVEKGITKGATDTTFAPDATCTRGQIVTFLYRFKDSPAVEKANSPFTDLKPGAFYEDAIAWAVAAKVTNGMTDTTFVPDGTCLRGQVVTFLYRAMDAGKA